MNAPARYWSIVALLTATVAGLDACTSHGFSPMPSLPGTQQAPAAIDAVQPEFKQCATRTAQPRWIFLGPCGVGRVKRAGNNLFLPAYHGVTVKVTLPRNDAAASARVRVVDAIGTNDIRPFRGKPFRLDTNGFLYLEMVNPGKEISFRKGGSVRMTLAGTESLGDQCGVARLLIVKKKWNALASASEPAGDTLSLAIPTSKFPKILHGPTYLAFFCSQPVPTPTPSTGPTTSPTSSPAAYCANYHTPAPNAGNQPVYLTDKSGLGAQVVLYVTTGNSQYLAANGQLTSISFTPPVSTPAPLPLACFPGSMGGKGQVFEIPAGANGLLYVTYATPVPGNASPPQPFANVWSSSAYQPSLNPTDPTNVKTPWDKIEYTLPAGGLDLTAEDSIGLPMELKVGSSGYTIGVSSAGYANILSQFEALTTPYKRLLVSQQFNGHTILDRIIAPRDGQAYGMPQDWWFNQAYYPGNSLGYLGYVLAQYKANSSYLYDLTPVNSTVTPVAFDLYCGSANGVAKFVFTPVASTTTSCPAAGIGATVSIPIADYEAGASVSCAGLVWGQPYGNAQVGSNPSTDVFTSYDAFYLWKASVIDFDRGTILATSSSHPVGGFATGNANAPAPPADFSLLFPAGTFNDTYADVLHTNFDHNQTYAIPYDEPGNLASVYNSSAPTPWYLTVNAVPQLTSAFPAPSPTPTAAPCAALPNVRKAR